MNEKNQVEVAEIAADRGPGAKLELRRLPAPTSKAMTRHRYSPSCCIASDTFRRRPVRTRPLQPTKTVAEMVRADELYAEYFHVPLNDVGTEVLISDIRAWIARHLTP